MYSCRIITQAFCNCLVNLPGQSSFEGMWITGEGTENLVLYMVGNCLILFLRIACSSTHTAFILAQWAESHRFLSIVSGSLPRRLLTRFCDGSMAAVHAELPCLFSLMLREPHEVMPVPRQSVWVYDTATLQR